MTRADNEQEFVLGNKQLLSAFFVVVALLGVFFVMGYIIGRNTGASDGGASKKTAAATEPANNVAAIPADPVAPPPTAAQENPTGDVPTASTKPARMETKKPEAEREPEKIDRTEAKPVTLESTSGRTFLQVMAVKRAMGDQMVKVLKERGFPALLGESSKPELLRVLVGPYADTDSLAKAKTDLKKMGFDAVVSK